MSHRLTGLGLWGAGAVNWLYLTAIGYSAAWARAEPPQAARSCRHHGLTIADADKRSIGRSLRSLLFDSLAAQLQALGVPEDRVATLDLVNEPRGADYRSLLQFLRARATTFSLVWRSDARYEPSADVIRGRLAPALLRTEGTSQWPGTHYMAGLATVRHYRATIAAIAVLAEAGALYAWRAAERPEDLAFYGATGQVLFGSIAHEADSWFELAEVSEAEVRAALPGFQFRRTELPGIATDA